MSIGSLGFLSPWLLLAGLTLPLIWWLLRMTPPSPDHIFFPATRLLLGLDKDEHEKAHSPWWLTLLRLLAAAAIIFALARPVLNPPVRSAGEPGPLVALIDDGWASAANWTQRVETMTQLLATAEQNNQPVLLIGTAAPDERATFKPVSAFEGREQFAGFEPKPYAPKRMKLLQILQKSQLTGKKFNLVWLSDGLDYGHSDAFAKGLLKLAQDGSTLTIVKNQKAASSPLVLLTKIDKKGRLVAQIKSPGGVAYTGRVIARDAKGRPVLEKNLELLPDTQSTSTAFDLPIELRNQITRMELSNHRSAAGVFLIDGRSSWQRVGLISGEAAEEAQPLLSPLYYIKKALSPYTEIAVADSRNTAKATTLLLSRNVSTLMLAGIGRLENKTGAKLADWITRGGTLVRFAGPRLAEGGDNLLPVPLRTGGRSFGGALSWSKPQKLSQFEENSPFFGLEIPRDVSVKRQVLADPSQINDNVLIWARLEDGTPLVTARKMGQGLLVLFHLTANSNWSDLPHSLLFVNMLRRLVDLSSGITAKSKTPEQADLQTGPALSQNNRQNSQQGDIPVLPPLRVLNGFGKLVAPGVEAEPIKIIELDQLSPDATHPPGLYGAKGKSRTLNIGSPRLKLHALPPAPKGVFETVYQTTNSLSLAPYLLILALLLFLADGLIVALMQGQGLLPIGKARLARMGKASLVLLVAGFFWIPSLDAQAAPKSPSRAYGLKMSMETHLAYVRTGNPAIDRVSNLGLSALSRTIGRRTAFEPASPVGVDIAKDELAFFPMLYWPVQAQTRPLNDKALARVNAYMKQGGVILFDTQDQMNGFTRNRIGKTRTPLAKLLSRMDIPRLEPVPANHVLTRSFYLLDRFPGRWSDGTLWVEASGKNATRRSTTQARSVDGVSSILITSNDLAAAWATDKNGRTLFAVSPDGERQREMAYRTGINIVLYAMTGNYKADQVHLPALMRRLGQ